MTSCEGIARKHAAFVSKLKLRNSKWNMHYLAMNNSKYVDYLSFHSTKFYEENIHFDSIKYKTEKNITIYFYNFTFSILIY